MQLSTLPADRCDVNVLCGFQMSQKKRPDDQPAVCIMPHALHHMHYVALTVDVIRATSSKAIAESDVNRMKRRRKTISESLHQMKLHKMKLTKEKAAQDEEIAALRRQLEQTKMEANSVS